MTESAHPLPAKGSGGSLTPSPRCHFPAWTAAMPNLCTGLKRLGRDAKLMSLDHVGQSQRTMVFAHRTVFTQVN